MKNKELIRTLETLINVSKEDTKKLINYNEKFERRNKELQKINDKVDKQIADLYNLI